MRKRILFIINPISGIGKQGKVENVIHKLLNKDLFSFEIIYTNYEKHAIEISKSNCGNFDIIVAVGGDGSINEVIQGLINSKTCLGVIPAGSGNGFARFLNIPLQVNRAIEVINNLKEKRIDTLKINHTNFVNVAGVGFDAMIGKKFAEFGKRGFWAYFLVITREIIRFKSTDYEVIIDQKTYKSNCFDITVANSSQFGFNAHISPHSLIDDGLAEVVFVRDFPLIKAPLLAFRLLTKTLDKSKYVRIVKGRQVQIKNYKKTLFAHIDGEPVDCGDFISIEINPLSLSVIVP